MPTGYTDKIKDGITFKEFAMNCARAFGACITMRDESSDTPIPDKFEPSQYHVEALEKAQKELDRINTLTFDECELEMEAENQDTIDYHNDSIKRKNDLRKQYENILTEVYNYVPPTPDHDHFRDFMIRQIEESIEYDCSIEYNMEMLDEMDIDVEKWKQEKIDRLTKDIKYHLDEDDKERERVAGRNQWLKQLRESLQ